jgi:hypothetical protein
VKLPYDSPQYCYSPFSLHVSKEILHKADTTHCDLEGVETTSCILDSSQGLLMGKIIVVLLVLIALYFKISGGDVKHEAQKEEPSTQLTNQELQDAKDFAQALIQRDYTCDKVTTFSNANFSGRIDVWCDDQYQYEITKPGGRWQVVAK